jgi:hypothetical protein
LATSRLHWAWFEYESSIDFGRGPSKSPFGRSAKPGRACERTRWDSGGAGAAAAAPEPTPTDALRTAAAAAAAIPRESRATEITAAA